MILLIQTEISEQTVQTQIRLQSDLGYHCLTLHLHLLDTLLCGKTMLFKFQENYSNNFRCPKTWYFYGMSFDDMFLLSFRSLRYQNTYRFVPTRSSVKLF